MKKTLFLAMIALSVSMVSCCNKPAQEDKPAAEPQASASLSALRIANDLAVYGYEVESAAALIEAADLLASVPTAELKEYELEHGEAQGEEGEKVEREKLCPMKMIADARKLTEDPTLLAMADKVEAKLNAAAEGSRGAVDRPIEHYDRVLAGATDRYYIAFRGNELAEIAIVGDGDTDLDLYVYDANGNLIVKDDSYSGNCYVSFFPRVRATYTVRIKNRGNVYNNYCLLTN